MNTVKNHWLVSLVFIFFAISCYTNLITTNGQHFTILSESFLNGHLNLTRMDKLGTLDTVYSNGKYYWHLGPFPAILLTPFVFIFRQFHLIFYQGYLQIFITAATFYICYKLSILFKFRGRNAVLLAFAFIFSSVYSYITVYTQSWFFSQSISTVLVLFSLLEFYTKKRYWIIGIVMALVLATRPTASIAAVFFILTILFDKKLIIKDKLDSLAQLLLPLFCSAILLLTYNYLRFGDITNNGYKTNLISPDFLITMRQKYGLFSLKNILTNFYWYFLASPEAVLVPGTYHLTYPFIKTNGLGISFFITSPIFITIFNKAKNRLSLEVMFLWITSLTILVTILSWYASGYFQIGPRYMLDLLPLWFILLLYQLNKSGIKKWHINVIILGAFLNLALNVQFLFG